MSCGGCVALPHDAMGLSAVCDCVISWSYSLTIFELKKVTINNKMLFFRQSTQNYWTTKHEVHLRSYLKLITDIQRIPMNKKSYPKRQMTHLIRVLWSCEDLAFAIIWVPRHSDWPQGYKKKSCSTQLSTKFILLINVKMPTSVGILTFISMINTTSERLKASNFFICLYFSFYVQCVQLSWAWKKFYNLRARFVYCS